MGRSKFPGKPSKLSSKKRVSVLVSTSPPSSAVSPAVSSASASSPRGGGKSPQIIGINEDTAINNNLSGTSNNITAAAELEQQINSGVRRDDDQINCNGGDGGKNNKNHVALSGGSAVIKLCACHDYLGGGGDRKSDVLLLSSTSSSSKSKVCAKCNLPSRNNGCTTQQLPNGTDNVMSSRNIRDGDQHQDIDSTLEDNDAVSKEEDSSANPQTVIEGKMSPPPRSIEATTSTTTTKKTRKKMVTFKNILETSDDITVKKVYNPSGTPLVPIIKKDSILRCMESIVKPSRLTEIVKQSTFNNLNRIKTLGFDTNDDRDEDEEEDDLQEGAGAAMGSSDSRVSPNNEDEPKDCTDAESPPGKVAVGDKRFILPKRSLHSRRVIKPNKKFLDDMDGCSAKALKRVNSGNKTKSVVKTDGEDSTVIGSSTNATKGKSVSLTDSKESAGMSTVADVLKKEKDLVSKEVASLFGQPVSSVSADLNLTPFGSNKVILRQPRLQFAMPVSTPVPMNNLFGFNMTKEAIPAPVLGQAAIASLKSQSIVGSASPVVCAICSTKISFNYFEKSSRKFGVHSCELCRKFISKMIKRHAVDDENAPTTLLCTGSEGKCPVDPIPSQVTDWLLDEGRAKTLKAAFKKRCHACWLNCCLKTYHLSSNIRARLVKALPKSMRESQSEMALSVLATPLMGASTSNTLSPFSIKREEAENQSQVPNLFSSPFATSSSPSSSSSRHPDESDANGKENKKSPPVLTKLSQTESKSPFGAVSQIDSDIKFPENSRLETRSDDTTSVALQRTTTVISPTNCSSPSIDVKETATLTTAIEKPGRGRPKKVEPVVNASGKEKEVIPSQDNQTDKIASSVVSNGTVVVAGASSSAANAATDNSKRQKIDLKGPRVKHVCRSASIVLGQPLATFPLENLDTPPRPDSPSNVNMVVDPENRLECSTCITDEEQQNFCLSPPATPIHAGDSEALDVDGVVPESGETILKTTVHREELPIGKGTRKAAKSIVHTAPPTVSKQTSGNMTRRNIVSQQQLHQQYQQIPMISIDFWENYDPVEISQMGFGLIVTDPVPLRSICFLCGSLGSPDSLMYCVCCCEPYHQYCIEDEYNVKPSLDETMNMSVMHHHQQEPSHLNWVCPRCTVCTTCNMSSGTKLKCQKCQKNYHSTCLGTSKRLLGADRPLICASCLKCKSCGTFNVSKFVGNLPMCTSCFKLRQRGNFCPLCQKCYEENDFDLKMMECGECEKWVHARCEGLTDEQYNMLSLLPENIEFFCRRCTRRNVNLSDVWRDAVAAEFKAGLLCVIKLLSKSRQACALLRLSPRKKANLCICQPINSNRAIQFKRLTDPTENGSLKLEESEETRCFCQANQKSVTVTTSPSLLDIKRKINDNEYTSLQEFNYDVLRIINAVSCEDLLTVYKEILSEAFPWFQNETKACTDALEEDMYGGNMSDMDCPVQDMRSSVVPCEEQMVPSALELPDEADDFFYGSFEEPDIRSCLFCKKVGEGIEVNEYDEGRLLYSGQNTWVHTNCALWSAEVFEEIDGSLQNIHSAVSRGRMIKCSDCGSKGATVGCNLKNCGEHYHYPCAKKVNCAFMADKTVYCPRHLTESVKKKCQMERDFDVLRPVYVELDRKKKKSVEVNKIQFVIGSLKIKKLGRLVPMYSDNEEAIVPVDFLCSRLYWSMKEPWKIVEYTIRTTIHSAASLRCGTLEPNRTKHFVVDHSMNAGIVQSSLAEITRWQSTLNMVVNFDEEQQSSSKDAIPSLENISSTVAQTTAEEEPQNNADLLPPEIKEVIFDDLPHDILDGISMLDIFPKLMNYEDLMAMDSTTKEVFFNNSELSKDSRDNPSDDDGFSQTSGDSFAPSSSPMLHVEDALLSAARPLSSSMARELKRSKSEIFNRGNFTAANSSRALHRSQQRSSSFTWNSKLDPYSAKRRKVSMLQELGLSESVIRSLGNRSELRTNKDRALVDRRKSFQLIDETKNKNITWNPTKKLFQLTQGEGGSSTDAKECVVERFKIAQLDGMDDLSSDEGGSPEAEYESNVPMAKPVIVYDISKSMFSTMDTPVQCDRCHCAYRTNESYQRHLATCEPMSSTSESESEATSRSPEADNINQNMVTMTVTEINAGNAMPVLTPQGIMSSFNGQLINANYNGLHGNMMPIQTTAGQMQAVPINSLGQLNGSMQNLIMAGQPQQQSFLQPMNNGAGGFQQSNIFPIQNLSDLTSASFMPQKNQATLQLNGNTINFANSQNSSAATGQQQIISLQNGQNMMAIPQMSNYTTSTTTTTVKSNNSIIHSSSASAAATTTSQQGVGQKKFIRLGSSTAGAANRIGKVKQTLVPKTHQGTPLKRVMAKSATGTRPIQMLNSNFSMIKPNHQMPQHQTMHATPVTTSASSMGQATAIPGMGQNIIFQQQPHQATQATSQPIIVQQMPNGMLQYVSAAPTLDQSHAAANNGMQYILPASNANQLNYANTGSYQLQQDASGNLILANTGGIQMLSGGMPIAQQQSQVQPQVIGTIIQPQATTIQCGMMAEQMMMGGTQTLEMVQDPASGCMYLTSQPMFYGLETIVQNTVMSSQQFVSTAMQGVLSQNSICQATTTQVFQASKIEPIMEVPGGYVVLNNVGDLQQQQQPQQAHVQKVNASQPTLIPVSSATGTSMAQLFNTNQQPQPSTSSSTTTSSINYQSHSEQHSQLVQRHLQAQSPIVQHQSHPLVQHHSHSPSVPSVKPVVKTSPIVITKIQPVVGAGNATISSPAQFAKAHQQVILPKPDAVTVTMTSTPSSSTLESATVDHQVVSQAPSFVLTPLQRPVNASNSTMVRPATGIVGKSVKPRAIAKPVNTQAKTLQSTARSVNEVITPVSVGGSYSVQQVENSITIQPILEQGDQLSAHRTAVDAVRQQQQHQKSMPLYQYKSPMGQKAKMTDQMGVSVKAGQQQQQQQQQQQKLGSLTTNNKSAMEPTKTTMRYTSNSQIGQSPFAISSTANHNTGMSVTYQFQQPPQIQLPNAPYAQTSQLTIPTNVVNPIQQSHSHSNHHTGYGATNPSRPMNRVLPMQTIPSRPSPPTPPEPKNHAEHENSPIRREVDVITLEIEQCEDNRIVEDLQAESNVPHEEIENKATEEATDGQIMSPTSHTSTNSTLLIDVPEAQSPASDDLSDAGHSTMDVMVKPATAEELFDNLKNSGEAEANVEKSRTALQERNEMKQRIGDILVSLDQAMDMDDTENMAEPQQGRGEEKSLVAIRKRSEGRLLTSFEKENSVMSPIESANLKESKKSRMSNALQSLSLVSNGQDEDGSVSTGPKLYFEIECQDGFTYRSTSINDVWAKVFKGVQQSRKAYGLCSLPEGPLADMGGHQMLGLKTNPLRYLLEQLPGIDSLKKYTPKYHQVGAGGKDYQANLYQATNFGYGGGGDPYEELKESSFGAARCEPYAGRSEYDMFSWLASRHRKQPAPVIVPNDSDLLIPRRGSSSNLPMAMRYRTLKETSKQCVGVFRSHIHGRGLYCTRDIEAGEMVIEYAGELIRATLTDKREKHYESKGIGCYMFRIDDNFVVDATMRGNAARFINHSCEPNCYSKVVDILGHKHIIIFALRRIVPGEELTYDYKFPFEDDKIPCSCGSRKCRKYLN